MKHLFTLLMLFLPAFGFAQEGIHLYVGGMPQITRILNRDDSEQNPDTFKLETTFGYAGMFKIGYNIGDPFGIHVGVLYSKQGQNSSTLGDSLTAERRMFKRDLRYIKIPLMLRFGGNPDRAVNLTVDFGPQLDLLLDANLSIDDDIVNFSTSGYQYKDVFKPQSLSITWAVNCDIRLSDFAWFSITHRGDFGVFDMENKEFLLPGTTVHFYPDGRVKSNNLNLGLMAGFTFAFLPDLGGGGQWWIR